jgi:hypothetical protein
MRMNVKDDTTATRATVRACGSTALGKTVRHTLEKSQRIAD